MDNYRIIDSRWDSGYDSEEFLDAWDIRNEGYDNISPEEAEKMLEIFLRRSQDGDPLSMLELGGLYGHGCGVEKNADRSLAYYQKAADLLFHKAYRCIGSFWLYNEEKGPDPKRAYDAFLKGALCGEQDALIRFSDFYYFSGEVVEADHFFAFALAKRAEQILINNDYYDYYDIAQDDCYIHVQTHLAECYLDGIGTQADIDKAIEYYEEGIRACRMDITDKYNAETLEWALERIEEAKQRQALAASLDM